VDTNAAPPAEPVANQDPPLLMSLSHLSTVESSDVLGEFSQGEPVSSQFSMFSGSEESIQQFTEEEMPLFLTPSSSPSISSFPSSADISQSILKTCAIVSSNPIVVKQIPTANSNVAGPKEAIVSKNSNVAGPKKVIVTKNNVAGPKVAKVSNSSVSGPKVAYSTIVAGPKVAGSNNSSSNSSSKGEPTLLKLSQNSKVSQVNFLSPSGVATDSDASSSESPFKTPHPPRTRRATYQSPQQVRSRSPLLPSSPGAHRGMPQMSLDR